jgi:hypothetical protein
LVTNTDTACGGSAYAGIDEPNFTQKEEKNWEVVIIQKQDLIQIFGRIQ